MLRNHAGAITGMMAGLVAVLLFTLMPGCVKTASVLNPGQKVTAPQLQMEAVQIQENLDEKATAIQQAIQQHSDADKKAVSDFNTEVAADNAKLSGAANDLASQAAKLQTLTTIMGGIASAAVKGTFDPISLIGTVLSFVGIGAAAGAVTDSSKKTTVISNLRTQVQSGAAPDPSAPAPQDSGMAIVAGSVPAAVPFVVQNTLTDALKKAA